VVAKRLDWEKAASIQKVRRDGPEDDHNRLPRVGSYADKKRYYQEEGYKEVKIRSIRLKKPESAPSKKEFGVIRQALDAIHRELVAVFDRENSRLTANEVWQKLSLKERQYLRRRFDLQKPLPLKIATEEELNSTLRESSLAKRQNLVVVMPQHFQSALEEANRLLAPEGRVSPRRK
jgi:hypothetical protein